MEWGIIDSKKTIPSRAYLGLILKFCLIWGPKPVLYYVFEIYLLKKVQIRYTFQKCYF